MYYWVFYVVGVIEVLVVGGFLCVVVWFVVG